MSRSRNKTTENFRVERGAGADEFARSVGLEIVEPDYFFTERRWQSLQKQKAKDKVGERA